MKDPNAWKYEDRLDFDGKVLKIGDIVAAWDTYFNHFYKGKVIKFTPLKVKIKLNRYPELTGFKGVDTTRYAEQLIKIK